MYSESGMSSSTDITRTGDGNIQWEYDHVLGSSSPSDQVMTLEMNGASWSENDITFVQYEADIYGGGTNYLV